jgi:hypothetical protein
MVLKHLDSSQGILCCLLDILLVVRTATNERQEPVSEARDDLAVGKRKPSKDGSVVLLGLAKKSGLRVLSSNYLGQYLRLLSWQQDLKGYAAVRV